MSSNPPPPPSQRRLAARAEKREAILAAARQVFCLRGVVEVTMDDIACAAGVSKGALYLHFESKDELYLDLTVQGAQALLERVRPDGSAPNGLAAVRHLLRNFVEFYSEAPMQFSLDAAWIAPGYEMACAIPLADKYRSIVVETMRTAVEAFQAGQRDGSIRPDLDAATTVYQYWGALIGLIILSIKSVRPGVKPPQADPVVWRSLQVGSPSTLDERRATLDFVDCIVSTIERRG